MWALALVACEYTAFDTGAPVDTGDPNPWVQTTGTTVGGAWSLFAGPCEGYRTETLVFGVDGSLWAGCGADTGGFHARSPDAWESVPSLARVHVYQLHLDPLGRVWVAGDDVDSQAVVFRGDAADGAGLDPAVLFSFDGTLDGVPIAAHVARARDGHVMVDSLNGFTLGISADDGATWSPGYVPEYQVLDLAVTPNGTFVGSGSTIAQPPVVLLGGPTPGDFDPVLPPGGFQGELFGVAALSPGRVIAVGVDEPSHRGILASCLDGDCGAPSSWTTRDVAAEGWVADAGRLHDVHLDAAGTFGIACGERYPQGGGGYALVTTDGGARWSALDTPDFPILTACWSFGDGSFAVAGGGGFLALSTPQ